MIRDATISDIPAIVYIGKIMRDESRYKEFQYEPAKVAALVENLIGSPGGIAIVDEKDGELTGLFLGVIYEHYFGPDLKAGDLVHYVAPQHRGTRTGYALLKEFVRQAKERGATDICVANSSDVEKDRVEQLYMKAGFYRLGGMFTYRG